jgi:hypothetical protein
MAGYICKGQGSNKCRAKEVGFSGYLEVEVGEVGS